MTASNIIRTIRPIALAAGVLLAASCGGDKSSDDTPTTGHDHDHGVQITPELTAELTAIPGPMDQVWTDPDTWAGISPDARQLMCAVVLDDEETDGPLAVVMEREC